jgi:hypothetical protein
VFFLRGEKSQADHEQSTMLVMKNQLCSSSLIVQMASTDGYSADKIFSTSVLPNEKENYCIDISKFVE